MVYFSMLPLISSKVFQYNWLWYPLGSLCSIYIRMSHIVIVTKLHSLTQRNSKPNNRARMYKATNLTIHCTGLPIENKERLVGGAYHISTKYTALYYRSIRITPFSEMWWCCLSHACYHFHFSWKDKYMLLVSVL